MSGLDTAAVIASDEKAGVLWSLALRLSVSDWGGGPPHCQVRQSRSYNVRNLHSAT
jgi:hypothetical protein